MILEQLCEEIRLALDLHRCRHKVCDCYRAKELLNLLEALVRVKHPWHPDLVISDGYESPVRKVESG